MAAAATLEFLFSRIKFIWVTGMSVLVLGLSGWMSMDAEKLLADHDPKINEFSRRQLHNLGSISDIGHKIKRDALLFNLPGRSYVDIMFYTDITAFGFIPDSIQTAAFRKFNRPMYVLNPDEKHKPTLEKAGIQAVYADIVSNE
jgi:hypothetical protein